jgi:uncharacterized protein with von Willebrand factor type A (vWA) domain
MRPDGGTARLVVNLANSLRDLGVKCSTSEVIDACNAASLVDPGDLESLREALRSTLVKNPEHYPLFDELFDEVWLGLRRRPPRLQARRYSVKIVSEKSLDPVSRFLNVYSPLEVSWQRRVAVMRGDPERRRRIGRCLRLYSRMAALKRGRRRAASTRGNEDLRRSMRRSLRTFGEILEIVRMERKKTRAKLVLVVDVSGSMADEWEWVCDALAALKQLPTGRYEAFLFSTRLHRVTEVIEGLARQEDIARVVVREFRYWGSGTRIGDALESLVREYPGILRSHTCVLIVSDGWDLGDLGKLEKSLAEIRRRVGHLAWLTPHASSPSFAPSTSCLRIAVKYVDLLLPTRALEDPRLLLSVFAGNRRGAR